MNITSKERAQSDKIEPLFSYRLIPWLLNRSKIKKKKAFYKNLVGLQKDIYELDTYLETVWTLKEKVLKKKWKRIFCALSNFGITKKKTQKWCKEIFIYQKQEVALRKKKLPTRLDLDEFYFFKSCDVKLMRRLLYRADPSLKKIISYDDWLAFDYLTEINDDIQDVFEDCEVYNCNRFLFALLVQGKSKVRQDYRSFIQNIQKKVEKRLSKEQNTDRSYVLQETIGIAKDTRALLRKRLNAKKLNKIAKAKTVEKWSP